MGPEQVGSLLRPMPIFLEGRALTLATPVAQELGLRAGQVVELVSAMIDGRARLQYGDRTLPWVGALPFPPGDRRAFRVRVTTQGVTLEPLRPSPALSKAAPEASASAPAAPELSALFRLLAHPSLSLAARAQQVDSLFALGEKAPPPAQLALPRPSVQALDGAAVRAALMHSGLFMEAQLGQRRPPSPLDMKRALLRVAQAAPAQSELGRVVGEVLAGLERAQAETLHAAQHRQELNLSWTMGFRDGPAVALELEREARRQSPDAPPRWIVHAATRLPELGPLWMRTAFNRSGEVDFTLWAPAPEAAALARQEGEGLAQELAVQGLTLKRFVVHEHPRKDRPLREEGNG